MNHDTDTPENDLPQDELVSQAYQALDKETTPAALDEHILAAARREVGSRPQKISFSRRWAVPISVAAVIVLSVSLFTMQQVPVPLVTAPAPESEPATIAPYSVPLIEEQEARTDAIERKQETLLKQRSISKPMKSDMPEADDRHDKDSAVGGAMMPESTPALKKEKAVSPAPGKISADAWLIEQHLAAIRQLIKDGKQEEALLALKTFQEHYPNYPLAEDLKNLLE